MVAPLITSIDTHRGALGQRLDYGDIIISSANRATVRLRNIPTPAQYVEQIEDLVNQALIVSQMPEKVPTVELIAGGENNQVELKSSLLWDYRRATVHKDL